MALYKRLIAWKECHQLVLDVYRATDKWPKHELYRLTSQTRRAAFSGAVNIVEGATRKGSIEFKLLRSLGSPPTTSADFRRLPASLWKNRHLLGYDHQIYAEVAAALHPQECVARAIEDHSHVAWDCAQLAR